jgi:DNA repair protein RadC
MATNVIKVSEKRELLKNLSVKAREYKERKIKEAKTEQEHEFWNDCKINNILYIFYKQQTGATEFKTFEQWNEQGYKIKKSEKGFLIWGKKLHIKETYLSGNEVKEKTIEYYGIDYVFSNNQVEATNKVEESKENCVTEISVNYKNKCKSSEMTKIISSKDIFNYSYSTFYSFIEHHEEVYALFLNKNCKCLGMSKISQGGISDSIVDVKIILQTALKANASGVILIHNHPSGNLQPSSEDDKITLKTKSACETLDLRLLDHIILSNERYYSYSDENRL